ncbi:MAG: hypothetical protein DMG40_02830, partial [Acidobacteria bacterium]
NSGRRAIEPFGKHASEGGASNNVAGPVGIRVETLRLSKLIRREPFPEAADGVGTHIQVDVPQVKTSI